MRRHAKHATYEGDAETCTWEEQFVSFIKTGTEAWSLNGANHGNLFRKCQIEVDTSDSEDEADSDSIDSDLD